MRELFGRLKTLALPAALGAAMLFPSAMEGADSAKKPAREVASFGTLKAPADDVVRGQAQEWLKSTGKTDEASLKAFNAVWKSDRPTLDKLSDTFVLGDPEVAKLLAEARDPATPAPLALPALLKDTKKSVFFRNNLALAYAKALSNRRVFEESLEAFKAVKPEQVVDPASYFFHRAVAEHALMYKTEADTSIVRLLDDVADVPERYRMVAALMHFDMLTWKDKDLGWVSRKMENIQRRLDLTRGGKKTQKMQKEVLVRLDEMIKELENQQKGDGSGSGQGGQKCPPGGQPQQGPPGNNIQSSSPQQDSLGGNGAGKGEIDLKKLKEIAEVWGKLPEKEQARRMLELTRGMPARYRDAIETYLKQISARSTPDNSK